MAKPPGAGRCLEVFIKILITQLLSGDIRFETSNLKFETASFTG
jgi:hypothetical protein